MTVCPALLYILLGLVGAHAVLSIGPHFWTRRDPGGDEDQGLVIFVESIRWLGVRWGMRTVAAGLRSAGFAGRFHYWRWHAGWRGWLVLPAIMDRKMLDRQARSLAEFITEQSRLYPDRPIHLMGCSCGGYVAVRALELLADGVRVDAAAMLAPAFAPTRDLSGACDHVKDRLLICSSICDWFIAGLGTLLCGTGDRRHVLSAGMVGIPRPSGAAPRVRLIRWRPAMMADGHWGGHFGASAAGFVRRYVAPELGIRPQAASASAGP